MKVIIRENEVGFVTKNGVFCKMLAAGKHKISRIRGYRVEVEEMNDEVDCVELPYQVLAKNEEFVAKTVRYVIPDGYAGFIYKNGNLDGVAKKSEYVFWNVFDQYEIKLFSKENIEMGDEITKEMIKVLPFSFYTKVIVEKGQEGLLYYNRVFQKILTEGIYYFWNHKVEVTARIVDLKQKELNVVGQEILTKDKIGIRMNVAINYKVVDSIKMTENIEDVDAQLYTMAQLVIRENVGDYKLDEILEKKETISKDIFASLKDKENTYYVEFVSAGIKDIILPGEIKDIMNSVLVAEKAAQANVIARREEVASTRSLLNTAKLMEENATLYKLKELEYLERICDKVGEISVGGNAGIVEQLGNLIGTR